MRRHPNRFTPAQAREKEDEGISDLGRRRKSTFSWWTKRGPKNRTKAWPSLKYSIIEHVGVVFH